MLCVCLFYFVFFFFKVIILTSLQSQVISSVMLENCFFHTNKCSQNMIYLQNGGGVLNGGLNFEWPWPADLHFGVLYFEMTDF